MSDKKEFEKFCDNRERYELTPHRYEEIVAMPPIKKLFSSMSVDWKKKYESINYVDLGCGDSRGTKYFSEFLERTVRLPISTTGIDASTKCASPCKERGINFLKLELGTDPLPLKNCQVITLFEVIEHIFNTDFLLESIRKSIANDGLLLLTTLNVVCWKNRIMVPLGIQPFNTEVSTKKLSYGYRIDTLRKRMDTWKPAGHIRPFTLFSLQEMLEDNGFKILKSYGLENWRAFKFLEKIAKNMCTGILIVAQPNKDA